MTYTKNRLNEVIFAVSHEHCWTSLVGDYVVKTINLQIDTEKDYIRSIITFNKKNKDLIYEIKKSKTYIGSSLLNATDNKILFDFRKKYSNSVINTVLNLNGVILNGFKYNGREFWRVLIYEDYLHQLFNELQSRGKVDYIAQREFDIEEDNLSMHELDSLTLAYKYGYLNFPRKIKSDKISKIANLSKSTFTYHLRSAEYKVIKQLIRELDFYNLPNHIKNNKED
ncbi:helix-turn-helix domain-containing protein [Acidianus brierleyi]|uniref:Helix-turn-helix domain-containing protein n=1 Tax=Acidianus brierleyi TaxID=41673 RepID=A0A2U9IHT1_9CREN|nr:helix-turn-helix domain-containing protein [Acidianus brierleyi]AWR95602.1 helix-turn-helix domain-containing protein [Acidianus brierleyi]